MGFEHIWAFALLPLPLLAWRLLPPLPEEVGLPVPAGVEALLVQLSSGSGHGRFGWPGGIALAVTGWIALVVALAGPQTENRQLLKPTGRDLIIALDLSASMAVEDMSANGQPARRYAIVRDLAGQFINQREGDRVGLIAFAQRAFLIAPLTFDTKAVSGLLDELSIGLPGRKTDVGKAVGLTIQTLRQEPEADRVLVLLSDGESNTGALSGVEAARLAAAHSIRVHTIGFSANAESSGSQVLQEIADVTGGRFFVAQSGDALARIYDELGLIEPSASPDDRTRLRRDWSGVALVISMIALMALVLWRRLGW